MTHEMREIPVFLVQMENTIHLKELGRTAISIAVLCDFSFFLRSVLAHFILAWCAHEM